MKKLLLHSCCGPCSTVCIERLKGIFEVSVFFCNPNVEPEEEYIKRKEQQIKVCKHFGIPVIDCDYDNDAWRNCVSGLENEKEGGARCSKCFLFRLEKTALFAKEHGFDLFSTTLTVSPYKNTNVINAIGQEISQRLNMPFLAESFKKKDGYLRSVQLAKELDLYRQHYCGCLFGKVAMEKALQEKLEREKLLEVADE